MKGVCLHTGRPLDGKLLMEWLQRLPVERGPDLLRTVEFLSIPGHVRQYAVRAVHMLMEGSFTKPWNPDENRESRLVCIGRNMDELDLRQRFKACVA